MFVHMSFVWIAAGQVVEAVEGRVTRLTRDDFPEGLHQSFVLESLDEPGQVVWLSFWNSPGEAKAFITSLRYAYLLEELNPYLQSGPEWRSYRLLEPEGNRVSTPFGR